MIEAVETGASLSSFGCKTAALLLSQSQGHQRSKGFGWRCHMLKESMERITNDYLAKYRAFAEEVAANRLKDLGKLVMEGLASPSEELIGRCKALIDQLPSEVNGPMSSLHDALDFSVKLAGLTSKEPPEKRNIFQDTALKTERQRVLGQTRRHLFAVTQHMATWESSAYKAAELDEAILRDWVDKANELVKVQVTADTSKSVFGLDAPLQALEKLCAAVPDAVEQRANFLKHVSQKRK